MSCRELDECFDGETLYRGIRQEWIKDDGSLSSVAVTVRDTSLERSKYRLEPRELLSPQFVEVAAVEYQAIRKVRTTAGGQVYEWQMKDDPLHPEGPLPANPAHSLAVVCREGEHPIAQLTLGASAEKQVKKGLVTRLQRLYLDRDRAERPEA